MAKRRTKQVKEKMALVLQSAIEYLQHPNAPTVAGHFAPHELARFLITDLDLIFTPGPLQEKKYVIGDLEVAAAYLKCPEVVSIPFDVPSNVVAREIQKVISDLK